MQSITLKVEGMSCGHCVNSVEGAVKKLGANGKVDLSGGSVKVDFDESKISLDAIKEAIEEQGYDVTK
ncbi:copper chaperone CopZ [Paenibacillus alginolyticus]|uniref:Copper chaperone CopZ n=1 Tax=Paenibacillus alginolyticus TaxID=59839 RepID=A0ABT4GMS7_9BACL|nr:MULTISPECIES: copper chaperone CopZ [Paenibacillus]MCY9697504.1 copper chaperone CopZ [Paenibacillus alginolyticus]MEC0141970.1 copper chaperone CopZ [Paenibacillus alginolyticus]NRF95241.1 copper chaperone CopZ [Paenibacillus frigoriresistens]